MDELTWYASIHTRGQETQWNKMLLQRACADEQRLGGASVACSSHLWHSQTSIEPKDYGVSVDDVPPQGLGQKPQDVELQDCRARRTSRCITQLFAFPATICRDIIAAAYIHPIRAFAHRPCRMSMVNVPDCREFELYSIEKHSREFDFPVYDLKRAPEELMFEAGVINDYDEERVLRIAQAREGRGLDDVYLDYGVDFISSVYINPEGKQEIHLG